MQFYCVGMVFMSSLSQALNIIIFNESNKVYYAFVSK